MELQCSAVQERWRLDPFDFISSSCCTRGCPQQRASASHFRLDGKPRDVLSVEAGAEGGCSLRKTEIVLAFHASK
jgi:hypothetical protein